MMITSIKTRLTSTEIYFSVDRLVNYASRVLKAYCIVRVRFNGNHEIL